MIVTRSRPELRRSTRDWWDELHDMDRRKANATLLLLGCEPDVCMTPVRQIGPARLQPAREVGMTGCVHLAEHMVLHIPLTTRLHTCIV